MAANSLAILKSSLTKLGVDYSNISAVTDNVRAALIWNEQYNKKRKQLLQSHYWNFAIKRHSFVDSGTTPEYEFTYAYTIPADYLRMVDVEWPEQFYQREGDYILSNFSPFRGRYVYDLTDTTKFSSTFDEALAILIASDICITLTGDKGLKDRIDAELITTLKDTRSFDAQENPSYPLMDDIFLNARL